MKAERVIIVGGPRRGKSTLAFEIALKDALDSSLRGSGRPAVPIRCGDPLSKVKEPRPGVVYLPEGLAMEDESTRWIVEHWFTLPGPWVCEGWIMARALRKWLAGGGWRREYGYSLTPADRVIVLTGPAWVEASKGQEAMHKGVMKVWHEIAQQVASITQVEYR